MIKRILDVISVSVSISLKNLSLASEIYRNLLECGSDSARIMRICVVLIFGWFPPNFV